MRLYVKQSIHHSDTWTLEERILVLLKTGTFVRERNFKPSSSEVRLAEANTTFRSSLALSVPYVLSDNTQKSQSFKAAVLRSNLNCLEIPSS